MQNNVKNGTCGGKSTSGMMTDSSHSPHSLVVSRTTERVERPEYIQQSYGGVTHLILI